MDPGPALGDHPQHLRLQVPPSTLLLPSLTLGAVSSNQHQLYHIVSEEHLQVMDCPEWQLFAFVLTLAWINLLIYMRQLPLIGKYITIFHDVLYTFLKVCIIIAIFVVAFALGFHTLLAHMTEFGTVQDSLMKVSIMMSGEFEYMSIFLENGEVPFKGVTYTIFVVFFFLVAIVTLNLLVGLTVDDIQTFLDEADLKNLKLKLKFVLGVEKSIPFSRRSFFDARIQNLR